MTQMHSTIITSAPDALITRHECACGYILETTPTGVAPLIIERGDPAAAHPMPGQGHLVLR